MVNPCVIMCNSTRNLIKPPKPFFSQPYTMNRSAITPLKALDELDDDDFERFVFFLCQMDEEKIPKGAMSHKSRVVVAQKMIETYGKQDALQITIGILKEMKNNNLASQLEKQIQQERKESDQNAVPVKKQRLAHESRETGQPVGVKVSVKGKDDLLPMDIYSVGLIIA